ncbi:MAG TPA: efflux RND transporter permease subunit, partial [Gammaproteobacteria bacterium]|nr:efflux RND transporter permease subunit [Gammaproteobacteria bacterium]
MRFLKIWLSNHVLANLSFVLVLLLGTLTYFNLPREQDPTINFNWVQISTLFPGASAEDVEKRVTEILEDAIRTISDIRFVSSVSRDSISSILVRFHDISEHAFEKKLVDLRREIQNKERLLPQGAQKPEVIEITSSNAFPSATIAIVGKADDNQLRTIARNVRKDLERLHGVDRVDALGLRDAELQSYFLPNHLAEYGITSNDIANSIAQNYQDIAAGSILIENARWLVRWLGTSADPSYLNQIPITHAHEDLTLAEVAKIQQGREKPSQLVLYEGKNAIILTVMKKGNANILKLVDTIQDYVHNMNAVQKNTGVKMVLLDDQTQITKNALSIMENNAWFGLLLVAFTCWIFLGFKISLLISLGIPFSLCATFLCLDGLNQTLNVSVLLGLVIALGMLVDDAVVVVEAIQYRLERGFDKMRATLDGLQEVFAPVCSSVMTTIAAFLPLMLMPGILGKFMLVIPMVVCLALIFSLLEAFWMLPAHILNMHVNSSRQQWRRKMNQKIRFFYTRILMKSFRYPKVTLLSIFLLFSFSCIALSTNLIKFNFFASDPMRLFYINVEMHSGTPITETLRFTEQIENTIRPFLQKDEARSIASYAGIMFTETEPVLGEQYGQVIISLHPQQENMRSVAQIIDSMRLAAVSKPGPKKITFMPLAGGPPTSKPINIKIRGDNFATIRAALVDVKTILQSIPSLTDIADNDTVGQP